MKFYVCDRCGNLVELVKEKGGTLVCCGQPMRELVPNTVDAAAEKHVPVITVNGNDVTVTVSTVSHPMQEVHYIEWIALETEQGSQRKVLHPGETPAAHFALSDGDKVVAAYAYCNLHGLWKGTL